MPHFSLAQIAQEFIASKLYKSYGLTIEYLLQDIAYSDKKDLKEIVKKYQNNPLEKKEASKLLVHLFHLQTLKNRSHLKHIKERIHQFKETKNLVYLLGIPSAFMGTPYGDMAPQDIVDLIYEREAFFEQRFTDYVDLNQDIYSEVRATFETLLVVKDFSLKTFATQIQELRTHPEFQKKLECSGYGAFIASQQPEVLKILLAACDPEKLQQVLHYLLLIAWTKQNKEFARVLVIYCYHLMEPAQRTQAGFKDYLNTLCAETSTNSAIAPLIPWLIKSDSKTRAGEGLAVSSLLCDGYLQFKNQAAMDQSQEEIVHFFKLLQKIEVVDLQMVVWNRVENSCANVIPQSYIDAAWIPVLNEIDEAPPVMQNTFPALGGSC